MTADGARLGEQQLPGESLTTAELVDRLSRFQGPPGEFLVNLLAVQCRLTQAAAGAVLRIGAKGRVEVIAMFPPPVEGSTAPVWLAQAVESTDKVISGGATAIRPVHSPDDLYGQPAGRHLVMLPLKGSQGIRGAAAFVVAGKDPAVLTAARERLELSTSLLSLYEMQLTLQRRQADLYRLRMATEVLASVNQQERFTSAAMSFCNEVAARWQCERVSLGILKGRYVHLKAMSHTEKFSRKMKIVQDIESAMEECIDQDVEVAHPAPTDATYFSRAATELSKRHGPTAIVSLPLRTGGEPTAVLTVERSSESAMSLDEVEPLRLGCDLCTARLMNLYERDRWFGAKAAAAARKALAFLIGPRHTWIKVIGVLILAAILLMVFLKGDYTVHASYSLKPTELQVVSAPFDGKIASVDVKPGDDVIGGRTVLAKFDTKEITLLLKKSNADRFSYLTQAAAARREEKVGEAHVAEAEAAKAAVEIELLEYRLAEANLVAPVTGHVIAHNLEHRVNEHVKTGDVLFEVAPLESLQADLLVPEDQIADVAENQKGELSDPSSPDRKVGFKVERMIKVAEVAKAGNVYRVRVRLDEIQDWMQPKMEGDARISVEERPYIELWTRRLINWVRMKLWL